MGIYIKGISMPEFGEKIIILTSSGYVEDVSGQVIDGVEAVSADVQPVRHGRWIPVDEMEDAFDCSECDAMVSKRLNYCPKCGAKMDKEE